MQTDSEHFIQCAYDAYAQGIAFDAIEELCACSKHNNKREEKS